LIPQKVLYESKLFSVKKWFVSLLVVVVSFTDYSIASSSAFQIRNGQSCTKKQIGRIVRFQGKSFLCVATKYGRIWTFIKVPTQSGNSQTTTSTTSVALTVPSTSISLTPTFGNGANPKVGGGTPPPAIRVTTTTESPLNASPVAGDLTGPVIVSASVVPSSVDVSDGPVLVTVTATYVDSSGMNTNLSWATLPNYVSGTLPRISGDARNGTYQRTFVIPQGSRPSVSHVTINGQGDVLGNVGQAMMVPFTIINRNWGVAISTTTVQ